MNYRELFNTGALTQISHALFQRLRSCDLCPHACCVDRMHDKKGFCRTGRYAKIDGSYLHFEEECELIGHGGSGTVFFSYCNLGCCYCQNYEISHEGRGKECNPEELAARLLELQAQGAENINFVSPTHVVAQIVEALLIAVPQGLHVPLVYNCGGFESVSTLRQLRGIFDIYMPDIKYSDNAVALRYSQARSYWDVVRPAAIEMFDQVGGFECIDGAAKKGLLIRHLVLPQDLAGSREVFTFIKEHISADTYVNIMDQYYPCFKAFEYKELSRKIIPAEYQAAAGAAQEAGLRCVHITRSLIQ